MDEESLKIENQNMINQMNEEININNNTINHYDYLITQATNALNDINDYAKEFYKNPYCQKTVDNWKGTNFDDFHKIFKNDIEKELKNFGYKIEYIISELKKKKSNLLSANNKLNRKIKNLHNN